jgi:NitT/TauT family transport system ATP-binding protein
MNRMNTAEARWQPAGSPAAACVHAVGATLALGSDAESEIQCIGVSKSFGTRGAAAGQRWLALEDVSLSVKSRELLVVVGPSGCGKSTLLGLLGGLAAPSSGQIWSGGKLITGPASEHGIVFQQQALFPWRTALENVEAGLEPRGVPANERRDRARRQLQMLGLSGFEDRFSHELSAADKQRITLACSLAQAPRVLLLDEPFAGLDAQERETLQQQLLSIQEQSRLSIVLITHDLDEAVSLGQRVAVMSSRPGRIMDVIEIPSELRRRGAGVRSSPLLLELRHQLRTSLADAVRTSRPPARASQTCVAARCVTLELQG